MANAKLIQENGAETSVGPRAKTFNAKISKFDLEDMLDAPFFQIFQASPMKDLDDSDDLPCLIIARDAIKWAEERISSNVNQRATEIAHNERFINSKRVISGHAVICPTSLIAPFLLGQRR